MNIFGQEAPKYWAVGLPVIPLRIMDKRPFFSGWSKYCTEMPTIEEQQSWAAEYQANNMGLPLGPQSGLVAIDYDYDDDRVLKAIMSVLPKSPWERVGQRGKVMVYRYAGHEGKKIYDKDGRMVVEILSEGNQIVLPPSIHPKTQQPYVSTGNLYDMVDNIPALPNKDELEDKLRQAISQVIELKEKNSGRNSKFRSIDVVPLGSRDIQMTRHSGFLSHLVIRGDISLMDAFSDMRAWYDDKVAKVDGDQLDVEKGYGQIVKFLINDVETKGKILPPGWDNNLTEEIKEAYNLNFGQDQEEWTQNQLFEYIDSGNVYGPNSVERQKVIDTVLRKVAKSKKLQSIEVDAVLQALKSDTKLPVSAFKRQVKELQAGPIEGISHTEIAVATIKEIEEKHGKIALWNQEIWSWGGSNWEKMDEQVIRNFIQKEFGDLQLGKRYSDHKQIVEVIKDNVQQGIKPQGAVNGVNFANGFLNRNMELLAHAPEHGMTYTLPFAYNPEMSGKSPLFFKYLEFSWGEDPDYQQKLQTLREAIAVTLFGVATSYQRCFLLYGVPSTGKSVLINIISAMVPDQARDALSPDKWDEQFLIASFTSKLLNVCGELDKKKKVNGKVFKEVITGEEMTTRGIYGKPFSFRPSAAHWFASNFLPSTNDTSGGFNRRWLILEFTRVVKSSEIIRNLADDIIYEEIEAIVAWALEVFPALDKREDYTLPQSHTDRIEDMEMQNSNVRQWMKMRLGRKEGGSVSNYAAYQDYWNFCSTAMLRQTLDPNSFRIDLTQFLAEKGIGKMFKDDDGQIKYSGIQLLDTKAR